MFNFFISFSAMQWFMSNLGVKVLYLSNFGVPFFANAWVCRVYGIPHFFFLWPSPSLAFYSRPGKGRRRRRIRNGTIRRKRKRKVRRRHRLISRKHTRKKRNGRFEFLKP